MPTTLRRLAPAALAALLVIAGCGSTGRPVPVAAGPPPESPRVRSSGSVPPGYYSALERGGIDPGALACNSQNRYGSDLREDARAAAQRLLAELDGAAGAGTREALVDVVFWSMVRTLLVEGDNNNLGAIVLDGVTWTDGSGRSRPVVVFRSGFTPSPEEPGSCFDSLLTAGGVRHVVNLYDGEMAVDDLIDGERRAAEARGASYVVTTEEGYGAWRDALRHAGDGDDSRRHALEDLARLIREQILAPGGEPPRGNILIHCAGGMHRSGMVAGILQRAVNDDPWPEIEASYRYHVGYQDELHPGGFEEENLETIRDFDPGLLGHVPAPTPR